MNTLIVCITGFMAVQQFAGLPPLAEKLRRENPTAVVRCYGWNRHAELIAYLSTHEFDRVIIIGHSYGVSTGMFVCTKLQDSLKVAHFISIDGVWRPDIDRPSFKSLRRASNLTERILVPKNVLNLHTFRQTGGRVIQGHGFLIDQVSTSWVTDVKTNRVRHVRMDRFPPVWHLALGLAGSP